MCRPIVDRLNGNRPQTADCKVLWLIKVIGEVFIARMMNSVQGLNREYNAPFVRKAEHGLKLKFNISPFSFWLSSCSESVASYCKMGR